MPDLTQEALVVEQAAKDARDVFSDHKDAKDAIDYMEQLIYAALARIDGLALVRELRAERDALKQKLISPDPYEDTAHPDDHAVNRFAAVMKGKLAAKRLQGRGGWQEPEVPNGYLSRMLREHVDKGDPVDVANLAMMIHQRGERIAPENEGASCKAIDKAEAEAAELLTRLAAAEAQVGALTAERDEAKRLMQARHREMLAADDLMRKHQRRAEKAEAERDDALTRLSALAAHEQGSGKEA